jgi:hypothetical protein
MRIDRGCRANLRALVGTINDHQIITAAISVDRLTAPFQSLTHLQVFEAKVLCARAPRKPPRKSCQCLSCRRLQTGIVAHVDNRAGEATLRRLSLTISKSIPVKTFP